jgi:transcriptional regulator with XRE-family HTH domain
MTFLTLQDQLREHIRTRIRRKELTGSGLARAAGFPQGHLSNFLNFRRGLSLESMDRLLETLGIEVVDLVGIEEIQRRAGLPGAHHEIEHIALVSSEHATLARFSPEQVLGSRAFSKSFLRRLRPSEPHHRDDWQRFVLIKLDTEPARELFSSDAVTATVLIDRHYNSLEPYRRANPNLYAVNFGEGCAAGYLSLIGRDLVLRTHDPRRAPESVHVAAGRSYSQHIIGRVVHIGLEV